MNIRWGTGDLDIANLSLVRYNVVIVHIGEGTVKVGATAAREVLDPVDNRRGYCSAVRRRIAETRPVAWS